MTLAKGRSGGFSQLSVWIPTAVKNELAAAAAREGVDQRDVLEAALQAYFDSHREKAKKPTLAVSR